MDVTLLLLLLLLLLLDVVVVAAEVAGPKANNKSQASTLIQTDVPWKNMENGYAGSALLCSAGRLGCTLRRE
jgi:hypothetical protein